jgi:hypothetical protein
MQLRTYTCLTLLFTMLTVAGQEPEIKDAPVSGGGEAERNQVSPELRKAIDKLALPGVKINLDEWCVDVDSRVCLREGLLELIACTKDTKEHESIIVVDAKAAHIHTALLLIGAKPGNPASMQPINDEMTRFRHLPPSGAPIEVLLVIKDAGGVEKEHPISDFLSPADNDDGFGGAPETGDEKAPGKLPTHVFLFAGSVLDGKKGEPRTYLGDLSGNVISIATFGDELLCLPGMHDHANGSLMWQVNGDKLPELDSKITLRLRPAKADADAKTE